MTDNNLEESFTLLLKKLHKDIKYVSIADQIKGCDDYGKECVFKIGEREFVICPNCGRYKK